MPSLSEKQARFMKAVAHGMKPKGHGPSMAVAREYMHADMKKGRLQKMQERKHG